MVAGHVGGDLQHLDDRPFGILHREIGGLQPDRRTIAPQALEHAALGRAAGQFLPEAHVGGGGLEVLVAEDPMVLADQLVRRVADHREEQRVGGQYLAIGSETDGGDVLPDGIESPRQVFILGGAFHRPAFSAEEHRARLLDGACPSRGSGEPEIAVLPLNASVDRAPATFLGARIAVRPQRAGPSGRARCQDRQAGQPDYRDALVEAGIGTPRQSPRARASARLRAMPAPVRAMIAAPGLTALRPRAVVSRNPLPGGSTWQPISTRWPNRSRTKRVSCASRRAGGGLGGRPPPRRRQPAETVRPQPAGLGERQHRWLPRCRRDLGRGLPRRPAGLFQAGECLAARGAADAGGQVL